MTFSGAKHGPGRVVKPSENNVMRTIELAVLGSRVMEKTRVVQRRRGAVTESQISLGMYFVSMIMN
jgi:hypothetical protein